MVFYCSLACRISAGIFSSVRERILNPSTGLPFSAGEVVVGRSNPRTCCVSLEATTFSWRADLTTGRQPNRQVLLYAGTARACRGRGGTYAMGTKRRCLPHVEPSRLSLRSRPSFKKKKKIPPFLHVSCIP